MSKDNKKMRAAMAAVLAYIQEEEKEIKVKPDLWTKSGREITMNNNYLVQMRNLRR